MTMRPITILLSTLIGGSVALVLLLLAGARLPAAGLIYASQPQGAGLASMAAITVTATSSTLIGAAAVVTAEVDISDDEAYQLMFRTGERDIPTAELTGPQVITRSIVFATPGTRTVTVQVIGNAEHDALSDSALITVEAGNPASMSLVAAPPQLLADGTSRATITATVRNAAGAPLPEQPVQFAIENGSLTLLGNLSNEQGQVVTELLPATAPGEALITARTGDLSEALRVPFAARQPTTIELVQQPDMPLTADGTTTTELGVRLRDQAGNVLPETPVRFRTNLGSLSASSAARLAQTGTDDLTTATSADGLARALLTAPLLTTGSAQQATVQVTADDINETIDITFTPIGMVVLTASVRPTRVCIAESQAVQIGAQVLRAASAPLAGQAISFSTAAGSFSPQATATTTRTLSDEMGGAIALLYLTRAEATQGVDVVVTAAGQSQQLRIMQQCNVYLPVIRKAPPRITLTAADTLLEVGGATTITAIATTISDNQQPVVGHPIGLTTTLGTLAPISGTTDALGRITSTLTLSRSGDATVTAHAATRTLLVEPLIVTATAPRLALVSAANRVETGQDVAITVRLFLEANGTQRALANRPISFMVATGAGQITPTATTNASGEATATYTASDNAGTATIAISAAGAVALSHTITTEALPLVLEFTDSPAFPVVGTSYTLAARVTRGDQPVAGVRVSLRDEPLGNVAFFPAFGTTNEEGIFETRITPLRTGRTTLLAELDSGEQASQQIDIPAPCNDDEPNNFIDDASRFTTFGRACAAELDDGRDSTDSENREDDYYRIQLRANQRIEVFLSNVPTNANYEISIVDFASAQTLARGGTDDRFRYTVPARGPFDYVIRVRAVTALRSGDNPYILVVRDAP